MTDDMNLRRNFKLTDSDPTNKMLGYRIEINLTPDDAPPSINAIYRKCVNDYMNAFYEEVIKIKIPKEVNNLNYIGLTAEEKENESKKEQTDDDIFLISYKSEAFKKAHEQVTPFESALFPDYTKLNALEDFHDVITSGVLHEIEKQLEILPMFRNTSRKYSSLKELTPDCIAQIIISADVIGRFELSNNTYLLGMYQEYGKDEGIYKLLESEDDMIPLYELMYQFDPGLTKTEREEIKHKLMISAPLKEINHDPNLTAVGNGIWAFNEKEFLNYGRPECKYFVFTKKIQTNFNPNIAKDIFSDNDGSLLLSKGSTVVENGNTIWDVDEWMKEFFEDKNETDTERILENKAMTTLLWNIIHAFCRPNVNYKRAIWFGNPGGEGNNGKGTFTALLRNLLGHNVCKSLNLREFSENFSLAGITHWIGIIADENSFRGTVEDVSKYKCLVTHDPVSVNVKFGKTFDYLFDGMTLQCFNEYPNIGDKSGSFARRLLLVNWEKTFTGREKPEIKDDYIERREVLEYILYQVLTNENYRIDEFKKDELPKHVKNAIDQFVNDTVAYKRFIREFCLPDETNIKAPSPFVLKWTRLPIDFLYALYSSWHKKNYNKNPSETSAEFKNKLNKDNELAKHWNVTLKRDTWLIKDFEYQPSDSKRKRGKRTTANKDDISRYIAEPLIHEYDLKSWKNNVDGHRNQAEWECIPEHKFIASDRRYYGFISRKDADIL